MKSHLQNVQLQCWEHNGRIGTNAPYVCLYRSDLDSVVPLLIAIEELDSDGPPTRRSVTFAKNERQRQCSRMRLCLNAESDELRQLRISVDAATATIEMTPAGLQMLRHALKNWRDGAEDFGISPRFHQSEVGARDLESGELWFWGPTYIGP